MYFFYIIYCHGTMNLCFETWFNVFPELNERSRYNRRKQDLWSVILAVRMSLQIVLDALQLEETAVIDSASVPYQCLRECRFHRNQTLSQLTLTSIK
jgi:hypothetical protein